MNRLLVVDTETGGLDSSKHSILSLAAVVWEDGVVRNAIEIYVHEDSILVEPEAMLVNRISLCDLRERGLRPADAVTLLHTFLDDNFGPLSMREKVILVGHNIDFDVTFLRRLYQLADASYGMIYSHRLLDTAGVVRFLSLAGKLPLMSAGSTAAFEYFGIAVPDRERHTAKGDALATAELLTRLIERVRG